jgi:integrase
VTRLPRKEIAKVRARETFGALLPRFMERQRAKLKPRSYVEVERHLMKRCRSLHRLAIESLTRRTIGAQLAGIEKTSGPSAANGARAALSTYFTWLAREGYVESNPVSLTNKAIANGARERVPSDDELHIIWHALDAEPSQYSAILKLLLLTAARRDEVGSLRWSEVDLESGTITLPAARTKNRREHIIPLSQAALEILAAQPRRSNADGTPREHVFGNGADRGYQGWSKSKAELDGRIAAAGHQFPSWRPHDFRRSASTTLHERLKVSPHIVEAILGHVSGHQANVAGTYNRARYVDERRRALERWSHHVTGVATGKPKARVVDLRGRRR